MTVIGPTHPALNQTLALAQPLAERDNRDLKVMADKVRAGLVARLFSAQQVSIGAELERKQVVAQQKAGR
jgi:hypothetical protein